MGVPPLLFGPPPHRLSPLLFTALSRWPRRPRRRWLASGRRTPSPAGPCPLTSPSTSKGHARGHPRALILGAAPAPVCIFSGTSGQLGGAAHPQVPRGVVKTQFYSHGVSRMGFLSPPELCLSLSGVRMFFWGRFCHFTMSPCLALDLGAHPVPRCPQSPSQPPVPPPWSSPRALPQAVPAPFAIPKLPLQIPPAPPLSLGPDSWNSSECRPAPSSLGTGRPRFLPAPLTPLVPRSADELDLFLFFTGGPCPWRCPSPTAAPASRSV